MPRLIFIDECEKIKSYICLDKVAVKEYRAGVSNLLLVAGQIFCKNLSQAAIAAVIKVMIACEFLSAKQVLFKEKGFYSASGL